MIQINNNSGNNSNNNQESEDIKFECVFGERVRRSEVMASPDWPLIESLLKRGFQVLLFCQQKNSCDDAQISFIGAFSLILDLDMFQMKWREQHKHGSWICGIISTDFSSISSNNYSDGDVYRC